MLFLLMFDTGVCLPKPIGLGLHSLPNITMRGIDAMMVLVNLIFAIKLLVEQCKPQIKQCSFQNESSRNCNTPCQSTLLYCFILGLGSFQAYLDLPDVKKQ